MVINQAAKYNDDPLTEIFSALADPTRRAILSRLSRSYATVTEIAAPFDMSLPAISKHLKVLENAGLISSMKDAQYRPKRLEADKLKLATEWLESYRALWEQNFDNLDAYLQTIDQD